MKLCILVKDLLPLYIENMLSEDTAEFVQDHLEHCTECREEMEQMNTPIVPSPRVDISPLKALKKKLFRKQLQSVLLSIALVFILTISTFSYLTAPRYFPYTSDLLSITENTDGTVSFLFDKKVTGYTLYETPSENGDSTVYSLEAWTTTWDNLFQNRGAQAVVIGPNDAKPFSVYYVQNCDQSGTSAENILLYSCNNSSSGGLISLPGLSLWYLFLLSVALFVVFGVILLVFKRNFYAKLWLKKLLLLPFSYMIGHVFIMGFNASSYSEQRDFSLIILIATLLYCALLLILDTHLLRKEIRELEGCK